MTAEQTPEDGWRWEKRECIDGRVGESSWLIVPAGWLNAIADKRPAIAECWKEADADRIIADHDAAAALAVARAALERIRNQYDSPAPWSLASIEELARDTLRRIDEVGGRIKGNKD